VAKTKIKTQQNRRVIDDEPEVNQPDPTAVPQMKTE
jgi:hypothetical protein